MAGLIIACALCACESAAKAGSTNLVGTSSWLRKDAAVRDQLCVAAGTWAAATHYGEHVRRPDPLEPEALSVAQMRADAVLGDFQKLQDHTGLLLATHLAVAVRSYRTAIATGNGIPAAEGEVAAVLRELPPRCVLASREAGPS